MCSANRRVLAGTVSIAVGLTLSIGASPASAAPAGAEPFVSSPATVTTSTTFDKERYEELRAALASIPDGASAQQAARILYPGDLAAQREYIRLAHEMETAASGDGITTAAVPAVLIPYLVVIGRCVVGALGSGVVAEIINLVRNGRQSTAEARVDAAVGGCITAVVPPFLRPIARSAKKFIVNAIIAIIIRWG